MSEASTQILPAGNFANTEARTLRRRRSAASAALLSRPSMLTLGELVPSIETCVLVYTVSHPSHSTSTMVYALFEPNFLISSTTSTIRKLDRTTWERLRSHVEELRIVAFSSRFGEEGEPSSPTIRKPDCLFDLSMPTDGPEQKVISQIYLQPKSYTSVPARSKGELLEIEIHSPADAATAEERRVCLPTQVRTVLGDAEGMLGNGNGDMPLSAPLPNVGERKSGGGGNVDFDTTCQRILHLVQGQPSSS